MVAGDRRAVLSYLPARGLLHVIAEPSAFSDRASGACPVGRIIAYGLGDEIGYYVLMPLRADILAIGALIAWLEFSGSISARSPDFPDRVLVERLLFPGLRLGIENSTFNMAAWGHSYLVALYGSRFSWCSTAKARRNSRSQKPSSGFFRPYLLRALFNPHLCADPGLPRGEIQSHGRDLARRRAYDSCSGDLHRNLRRELSVHRGAADQDRPIENSIRQAENSGAQVLQQPAFDKDDGVCEAGMRDNGPWGNCHLPPGHVACSPTSQ